MGECAQNPTTKGILRHEDLGFYPTSYKIFNYQNTSEHTYSAVIAGKVGRRERNDRVFVSHEADQILTPGTPNGPEHHQKWSPSTARRNSQSRATLGPVSPDKHTSSKNALPSASGSTVSSTKQRSLSCSPGSNDYWYLIYSECPLHGWKKGTQKSQCQRTLESGLGLF